MFLVPINKQAPVLAQRELQIPAEPVSVWRVLTQINDWPKWQRGVTSAALHGPLQVGTKFTWRAGGLVLRSKIHTCEPGIMLGWTGNTIGASAIHNWTLKRTGAGTLVEVEESLDGIFPRLFTTKFKRELELGMKRNLDDLYARTIMLAHQI